MKRVQLFLFPLLLLTLTACPGNSYEDARKKLYKNHMDLPDPIKVYHDGVRFKISELFEDSYDNSFVLKANALTKIIYDLDLNFSVEKFSKFEAESYKFAFSENTDLLNAVHDHYAIKRQNSLEKHFSSIKKSVSKKVGFNGVIQTIEGEEFEDDGELLYFMSTIQIDENYFVFQLIGKKENMGYLYDDFVDILNSIEK